MAPGHRVCGTVVRSQACKRRNTVRVPQARRIVLGDLHGTDSAATPPPLLLKRKRHRSFLQNETPVSHHTNKNLLSTVSPILDTKKCSEPKPSSCKFQVKDIVSIEARTWPGINKQGGMGRITKVNEDGTYNVAYVLGGYEKMVEEKYISHQNFLLPPERPVKPRKFFHEYDQERETLSRSMERKRVQIENVSDGIARAKVQISHKMSTMKPQKKASEMKKSPKRVKVTSARNSSSSRKELIKTPITHQKTMSVRRPINSHKEYSKEDGKMDLSNQFKLLSDNKNMNSLQSEKVAEVKIKSQNTEIKESVNKLVVPTKEAAHLPLSQPASTKKRFKKIDENSAKSVCNKVTPKEAIAKDLRGDEKKENELGRMNRYVKVKRCRLDAKSDNAKPFSLEPVVTKQEAEHLKILKRQKSETNLILSMQKKLRRSMHVKRSRRSPFEQLCFRANPCYIAVYKREIKAGQGVLAEIRMAPLKDSIRRRHAYEREALSQKNKLSF